MNTENNLQKLKQILNTSKLSYEIIQHKSITTVEEGLKEIGIEAADGVSTLIMNADGNYIAIIRRDDKKLNFKKIKKLLHINNLQLVDRKMLKELTGCDVGYVSLLNENLPTLLDDSVLERNYVYGGTGSPEHDLKITPNNLVRLTSAQVVSISE